MFYDSEVEANKQVDDMNVSARNYLIRPHLMQILFKIKSTDIIAYQSWPIYPSDGQKNICPLSYHNQIMIINP